MNTKAMLAFRRNRFLISNAIFYSDFFRESYNRIEKRKASIIIHNKIFLYVKKRICDEQYD